MTLLRAGYRTMLASYFITSGVKAVRNPAPLAELAEPLFPVTFREWRALHAEH